MTKIKCLTFGGSDCRNYTTPKGNSYEFYKGQFTKVKDSEDALHFLNAADGKSFTADGVLKKIKDALIKAIKSPKKEEDVDETNPPAETGNLDPNADDLNIDGDGAIDGDAPIDGNEETATPESEISDKLKDKLDKSVDVDEAKKEMTEEEYKAEAEKEEKAKAEAEAAQENTERPEAPEVTEKDLAKEKEIVPEEPKNDYTPQGLKDLNKKQQVFLIKKVSGEEAGIPDYESERIKLLIKLQEEGANLLELIKEYKP